MTDNDIPSAEEVLRGETTIFLATSEGDQPRVRPVTLVEHKGELFILTGSKDQKIAQIKSNNKVECLTLVRHGKSTGYVRFTAKASIEDNAAVRSGVAKVTSFFDQFWDSAEHPGYALIRIQPSKVEYMRPGEMEPSPIAKLKFD